MAPELEIRPATPGEEDALESLQFRASLIWEEQRADLERNRDIVSLTPGAIDESRVLVATIGDRMVGFAEWVIVSEAEWELEGLFVEPSEMRRGIGSRLFAEVTGAGHRRRRPRGPRDRPARRARVLRAAGVQGSRRGSDAVRPGDTDARASRAIEPGCGGRVGDDGRSVESRALR